MSSHTLVWSGSLYTVNDEFSIANYSSSKNYVFKFNSFSGGGYTQQFFVADTTTRMQFSIQGETDQYRRYRIAPKTGSTGTFIIEDTYGQGDSGTALCAIYEIT